MKTLISVLSILVVSMAAHANQTEHCGETVSEVRQILLHKPEFKKAFPNIRSVNSFVSAFVGNWSGLTSITITETKPFEYSNEQYVACPQLNKTITLYKKSDRKRSSALATLKPKNRNEIIVTASGGMQVTLYKDTYTAGRR